MDYDSWCRKCKNYEFNMQLGILCGLTHEKPDFGSECNDYVHDPSRAASVRSEKRKNVFSGRRQQTTGTFMMIFAGMWIAGVFFLIREFPLLPVIIFLAGLGIYIRGRALSKDKS